MMKILDGILEILKDSKYHDFDEMRTMTSLQENEFNELLKFLQEQAFIEKKNCSFRIKPLGLKYLDLPC